MVYISVADCFYARMGGAALQMAFRETRETIDGRQSSLRDACGTLDLADGPEPAGLELISKSALLNAV